jgi:hypothetical protein
MLRRHRESHRHAHVGWLRAAVLGANDGIVSTASLLVGVAAADASHGALMTAGIAGAVAGAMSMAAGEYVSVSSLADSEQADLARERSELQTDDAGERRELMGIYIGRGLSHELAKRVADELMAHDALAAHGSLDGAAAASGRRFGSEFRLRRTSSADDRRACVDARRALGSAGHGGGVPCFARRRCRARGRGPSRHRCGTRDVVGRPCNGGHRCNRPIIRRDRRLAFAPACWRGYAAAQG